MGWLFGKKPREARGKPVIESAIPRDDERAGPVPPPPPTAHEPGVSVWAFDAIPSPRLLRLPEGNAGFFFEGKEGGARSSALLVLVGGGAPETGVPGDVLIWDAPAHMSRATAGNPPPSPAAGSPSYSLEELSRTSPRPHHHIRRDGLAGRGVPGLAGLRTLHAARGITVLRLGPPPGARWVFVGLEALAVFTGKLTLVDGEEARVVGASSLALVSDPTATLHVEAGNDSALAVALGGAEVVSALG